MRAGRGRRVILDGPAGIGKTSLLEETCRAAEALGMSVHRAQGSEVGAQVAFAGARELLGEHWPEADHRPEVEHRPEGQHRPEGEHQPADERGRRREIGPPDAAPPPTPISPARLVRALLDAAELGPLVLAIDDVQWLDRSSLSLLALLAERIANTAICLLLAVRGTEVDPGDATLVELLDDRRAIVVRPAPLTVEGAGALLQRRLGQALAPELLAATHEDSGGNPFLLVTLADALRQSGLPSGPEARSLMREIASRALARTLARRLAALDSGARALLEAAATVGPLSGVQDLAPLAGLQSSEARDAAQRLARADLLRSASSAEVSHPLIAAAVRDMLSAARRDQLRHAAAGALLETGRLEEAGAQMLELSRAGDELVVETLLDAARSALARGAREVAVALLERALAEPPSAQRRGEVLAALGSALVAGADPRAQGLLREAMELTPAGPQRAELAHRLSMSLQYSGRYGEAVALVDAAVEELSEADAELAANLRAHALHLTGFTTELQAERRRRLRDPALARPGASELAYRRNLAELALDALARGRPHAEVAALAERALAGGLLLNCASHSHAVATVTLTYAGQPERARSHIHDAIARSRAIGDTAQLGVRLGFIGETRRVEGDLIAAENYLRSGMELLGGRPVGPPFMRMGVIEALVARGEVEAAEAELRDAGMLGELPEIISSTGSYHARALVRIASGSLRAGLQDLYSAAALLERFGGGDPTNPPWRITAARVHEMLGEHDRALELAREQHALALRTDGAHAIGPALRLLGSLEGSASGMARLREAVALLEGCFAQLELAGALVDLGSALRAAGDRAQARELLARGASLADQLGATVLADRAREEHLRAGGRPQRRQQRGLSALSASQRQVAQLAGQGLTNREIAEMLVLSEKTVESHMTAAFRKLGVRSRIELPHVLARGAGDRGVPSAEHRSAPA